jgi:anion-transporting  ArsA/GET3 family ATPase
MELGHVPYSYYQYVNPSEFWAVNATDIMQKRFGVKDSTLGRMSNWLLELAEKAKGLFNLSTKSPLIKALDSLAKADGKFNSLNMLQEEGARYMDVSSLTDERNRRVLERAEQLERQDMKASVSALDEVIDDLNLVYESLPKDSPERANVDALEERLSGLLSRIESARRPSNENVPETELERAQREYEAAHKQFMDLFYNPDDERQFMDRRTRARKEYEKELDQLEKADREARDKWEKLYQKETERLSELMLKGSPADMKKAIAKAQEPDNKIMDERADIQKKNRGCD